MEQDKKPSSKIDMKSIKDKFDKEQAKKPSSEIDMKSIKDKFDKDYKDWLAEKQRESSSRGRNKSNHGDSSATLASSDNTSKRKRPMTSQVKTESKLPEQPIRGFVNESLFLKNFLLKEKGSEEFKTLGIVGKFGVGKTTLCQDVFNHKDVKQAYLPRIWVYSKEPKQGEDPKKAVLKRILRSLGVDNGVLGRIKTELDEETVKDKELCKLLRALNSNLFGKKYLIVLDDVWEDNKWNQRLDDDDVKAQQEKTHLSCGFPKGSGGRVIVISRDEGLAKNIVGEEENLQRLFPRSDVESVWEIYKDAVGEPMKDDNGEPMKDAVEKLVKNPDGTETKWVVNPRYPGRYKKELMDKSGGVPWAAQMLAKIEPLKNDEDKD